MTSAWPPAPRPSPDDIRAREAVVAAGERGDVDQLRAALRGSSGRARASALHWLARLAALGVRDVETASADPDPTVRGALAAVGATLPHVPLRELLEDADASVVETACWAAGEHGTDGAPLVEALMAIAADHDDALCREAAVAALGAVGDPRAVPVILAATGDRATVRRRAVLALAPFEGDDVDAALRRALDDRDWQVRQAAEDLLL